MSEPRTGDVAPDFTLQSNKGGEVKLSDFRGKKNVVLYFYPKDETAGCTAEACSFRDSFEDFTAAGAEVIGVSDDSVESHVSFAKNHRLPFHLLSDPGGKVRTQYGVKPTLIILKGRITFLIDRQGKIVHTFSSQVQMTKHVTETLKMLKSLSA